MATTPGSYNNRGVILANLDRTAPTTDGGNSSVNETYFNTKYWRLDGTNAPPSANWNMNSFGFTNVGHSNFTGSLLFLLGVSNRPNNITLTTNAVSFPESGGLSYIDNSLGLRYRQFFNFTSNKMEYHVVAAGGGQGYKWRITGFGGSTYNFSGGDMYVDQNIFAQNVCYGNGLNSSGGNCSTAVSSGGGFNADQQVNTTSNVTFNFVNITRNLNVGNVSNTSNIMTVRGVKANNQNKTLVIQNETGGETAIFASNGKLCLSQTGQQCNANALTLQIQRDGNPDGLLVYVSSDTATTAPQFQFRRARGSMSNSTNQKAVSLGDTAFSINVLPYDGALFQTSASLQAIIDDNNDTSAVPTGWVFKNNGQGASPTTKLYLSSRFTNYFNGTLTTQNNITQINTPTTNIIGAGDTDVAGVFNSLLINGTTFDACSGGGCSSGLPTWTSAFSITNQGFYKFEASTLPTCNAGTAGLIGYNNSGHYGCHASAWNRLY